MCSRGLLLQHPPLAEVQFTGVLETATKREVEEGAVGETAGTLKP
jgi:hypothetical protein